MSDPSPPSAPVPPGDGPQGRRGGIPVGGAHEGFVPEVQVVRRGRKPRSRWRWWRWLVLLLLLVALGAGAYFGGRPAYHLWQRHEARKLLAEAQGHLDAERWSQASKLLGDAYRKAPEEVGVLRSIHELVRRTAPNPERQLYFLRQIAALGEATQEDRVRMAECHLVLRQREEAVAIRDAMTPAERAGRYGLELEALLLRAEGRVEEGAVMMRRSWELGAADDAECRLKLAALDLRNPFRELQEKAEADVWQVARGQDRAALLAMDLISADLPLTPARAEELLALVRAHPFASPRRQLAVLGAYVKAVPERKEAVVEEEARRLEGQPVEDRMDFLRWLATMGDHERFLRLVPKDKALLLRELYPLYVEALAGAARWPDLQDALKSAGPMGLGASQKTLLQARLSRGRGEPAAVVKGYFQEACRHATALRDYRGLLRSAGLAEEAGYDDVALEAYRAAAAASRDPAVLERMLQIQQRLEDADAMLATLAQIVEVLPGSRDHRAARYYLKLLLGREMELCDHEARRDLAAGRVAGNAAVFLQALTAYRELDLERVKTLLPKVDATALSAGQRAVLAGLLAECGDPARAFAIAEGIPPRLLLGEEVVFLKLAL